MKAENAIEVKNITKKFKVYLDKGRTIKERILFKNRRSYEERMVLKGISFEVKKGEAIGLIGHNGCGKSTTLKLLTKIMYPDTGSIEMRGRVSSLIELGAGFHPDMSGRQNIYTNASIFGLTRKEIDARLDDIIAFSELEEFIDNPVRTYSSGMYMRLAFSVAINVDADILLIDEILAVGDANFQAKCFNKLREIKAQGTTIVIVSHSLSQIEQICERSLWIHEGMLKLEGVPRDVHPEYMDYMGQKRQITKDKELERLMNKEKSDKKPISENNIKEENNSLVNEEKVQKTRWGNGNARITKVAMYNAIQQEKRVFKTGEKIIIKVFYEVIKEVEDAVFGIGIFRSDGLQCYGVNTRIDNFERFNLAKNSVVELELSSIELLPGEYDVDLAIESGMGSPIDYYTKALKLEIFSDVADVGVCRVSHKWNL